MRPEDSSAKTSTIIITYKEIKYIWRNKIYLLGFTSVILSDNFTVKWLRDPQLYFFVPTIKCFHQFFIKHCLLKWYFRLVLSEKAFWHWLDAYGFSPVCILKWFFKWLLCEKAFGQWLHGYGFSPLSFFKWFLKLTAWENASRHWLHGHVFLWKYCENAVGHWLHCYGFLPVCIFMYSSNVQLLKKSSYIDCKNMYFQMRHCEKALEHWFHQNVLSNDSFNEKHSENSSNIDDKDMAS